jgi:hypothetical protein
MKIINLSIFVFSVSGVLLMSPGVHSADLTQDCLTSCANQKTADDANCPSPAEGIGQGRALCLKNDQDIYDNCRKNCLPNSPPPAASSPSVTPGTPSVPVPPKGTTAPQGTTPPQVTTPPVGTSVPKAY